MIFESGLAASSLTWTLVQPAVTRFARTCSYDRAGLGFSPPTNTPRTLLNLSRELGELLESSKTPAPYLLVAHSFGSLIVRHFAAVHPTQIAGMVLVDPICTADWCNPSDERRRMLTRGVKLARRGALLARAGIVRFSLSMLMSGSRRLPRLLVRANGSRAGHLANRLIGEISKLPPETWPLLQQQWSEAKCFDAMAEYLRYLPENASTMLPAAGSVTWPLVVISSANATASEREEHRALIRSSSNARHAVAERSGHWIPFDQPETIVEAIGWIIEANSERAQNVKVPPT